MKTITPTTKKTKKTKTTKNTKKQTKPESEEETLVQEELKPTKEPAPQKKLFFGKSDRSLYVVVGFLVIAFALFLLILFLKKPTEYSLDDYHDLNLAGELSVEVGYVYNSFSFVKVRGTWYTRFKRENNDQVYNVETRYSPREVEAIPITGDYNYLLSFQDTYITFNPNGKDFPHVALAAADMSLNMVRIFDITPHAACTEPHEKACANREIIECKQGVPVIYIKEDPEPGVSVDGTCLTIQGTGFDLVKAANRLLFAWYGIM